MVNIHCPCCINDRLIRVKPTIENGFTRYYYDGKLIAVNMQCKEDECLVYCIKCNHYHIMKIGNFVDGAKYNKPRKVKIKGYGNFRY